MTGRRAAAVALLAGAATVGAFAPLGLYPLALLGFAALIHLWIEAPRPAAAFRTGFWFGLGLFGCGVSWVYVSLHRFGAMPAPLAAIATLAFCAVLALYPALAGWLQARVPAPHAVRAVFLIPALWTLIEWLRGWVLTGFPWLSAGYSGVDTPLAGLAPLGGVYALSLATLVLAGLLWCMVRGRARWRGMFCRHALTPLGVRALPIGSGFHHDRALRQAGRVPRAPRISSATWPRP